MASIVQRFATRSVSGHNLGIDVHKHDDLLLMTWKQKGYERCYAHFLERRFLEKTEYTLLENYIYHSGYPCTLACLSSWLPGKCNFPPCPFLTSGPSRHNLYRRHRLSMRELPDFQFCRCSEILMLGDMAIVSVSIFSLNRHLKFSKFPTPPSTGYAHGTC